MNLQTISDFRADIKGKVYGNITFEDSGIFRISAEAMRKIKSRINPISMKRRAVLDVAYINDAVEFRLPQDVEEIHSVRLAQRRNMKVSQGYKQTMLDDGLSTQYSISYRNGNKVLLLETSPYFNNRTIENFQTINDFTSINTSDLQIEKSNVMDNNGVSFTIATGATNASVSKENVNIDLAEFRTLSLNLFIDDDATVSGVKHFTGINLTLSDGTNSVVYPGVPNASDALERGWNVITFDIHNMSTINRNAITSFKIDLNMQALTRDVKVVLDDLVISTGEAIEIEYASGKGFYSTTGGFQYKPTDVTDTIMLDDDAYQIFLTEAQRIVVDEMEAEDGAEAEIKLVRKLYGGGPIRSGLYEKYDMKHGSENKIKTHNYYTSPKQKRRLNSINYGKRFSNLS